MITEFGTELMPLTMRNPGTGRILTATVYTVPGVEGTLSMGQLVMAICLSRAADVENELVKLMGEVDQTSSKLKGLTKIQAELVKWYEEHAADDKFGFELTDDSWSYASTDEKSGFTKTYDVSNWREFLADSEACGMTDELLKKDSLTREEVETLINSLSDTMDANNAVSQDQLIKMQSLTTKRDQAHDTVTNVLKSFNTEEIGNANNMR